MEADVLPLGISDHDALLCYSYDDVYATSKNKTRIQIKKVDYSQFFYLVLKKNKSNGLKLSK